MPWTNDLDGERKYFVSIYTKEELPTWAEMWNEFYQGKVFTYDPRLPDDQVLDPYWKIPRKKVLLAAACNQLNKMIFEDGMKKSLFDFVSKTIQEKCVDVKFICEPIGDKDWISVLNKCYVGTPDPPPIYTYPLPTGKENFFITSTRIDRIDISQLDTELKIFPIIMCELGEGFHKLVTAPTHDDPNRSETFYAILDFMLQEMKTYFEGEGVGWKDENGHLIDSDPTKKPEYDPAL